MVKVAVLARPQLATSSSSGCISRFGAALGTQKNHTITSDPTKKPWPFSHTLCKTPFPLRLTMQAILDDRSYSAMEPRRNSPPAPHMALPSGQGRASRAGALPMYSFRLL